MIACKCKDCDKRFSGCHSVCEDYKEYRAIIDEMHRKERLEKEADSVLIRGHCMALKKMHLVNKRGYKSNSDWKGE